MPYIPLDHFQTTDDDHSGVRIRDMPYGKRRESIVIYPEEVNFTAISVDSASPPYPVIITNDGYDVVVISDIQIVGDFTFQGDIKSLAPGEHASLSITFTPKREGTITGGIYINSGNAAGTEFIPLTGSGIGDGGYVIGATQPLYLHEFGAFGNDNPDLLVNETEQIKTAIETAMAQKRELVVKATNYLTDSIVFNTSINLSMRGAGGKPLFHASQPFIDGGGSMFEFYNTTNWISDRTITKAIRANEKIIHLSSTTGIEVGMMMFLTSNKEWYYDGRDQWNRGEAHLISRILNNNAVEIYDYTRDAYTYSNEIVNVSICKQDYLRFENIGLHAGPATDPVVAGASNGLVFRNMGYAQIHDVSTDGFMGTGIYFRRCWHPTLTNIEVENNTLVPDGGYGVATGGGTVGTIIRNLVTRNMRRGFDASSVSTATAGGPTRDTLIDGFLVYGGGVDPVGLAFEPAGSCNLINKTGTFALNDILTGATTGYRVRLSYQDGNRIEFEQLGEYSLAQGEVLSNVAGAKGTVQRIHTSYTSKPSFGVGSHGPCENLTFINGRISNVGSGITVRGRNTTVRNVDFFGHSNQAVSLTYGEGFEMSDCTYNRNDMGSKISHIHEKAMPVFVEVGNSSATNAWKTTSPTIFRNITTFGLKEHFIRLNPGMNNFYNLFVENVECLVRPLPNTIFRFLGSKTTDATIKNVNSASFQKIFIRLYESDSATYIGSWNIKDDTIQIAGGRRSSDDHVRYENSFIFRIPHDSSSRIRALALYTKNLVLSIQTYDSVTGAELPTARGLFRLTRGVAGLVSMGELGSALQGTATPGVGVSPGKIAVSCRTDGYFQINNTMGVEVDVHLQILN